MRAKAKRVYVCFMAITFIRRCNFNVKDANFAAFGVKVKVTINNERYPKKVNILLLKAD